MSDAINPKHYQREGRKQCIEEMEELFGVETVKTFCLLNAYKYNYRHSLKNGEEDLSKMGWYVEKYLELGGKMSELKKLWAFEER